MGIEREGYGTLHVGERTLAMASYARAFFRSMGSEEFGRMIEDARSSGQQWLVERLYSRKVIDSLSGRSLAGSTEDVLSVIS